MTEDTPDTNASDGPDESPQPDEANGPDTDAPEAGSPAVASPDTAGTPTGDEPSTNPEVSQSPPIQELPPSDLVLRTAPKAAKPDVPKAKGKPRKAKTKAEKKVDAEQVAVLDPRRVHPSASTAGPLNPGIAKRNNMKAHPRR